MKLGDQSASGNVEERRGIGLVGGGLGIGGIVIAVVAYPANCRRRTRCVSSRVGGPPAHRPINRPRNTQARAVRPSATARIRR